VKIRELLRKIDNAIRPAHVGSLPPTDVTERGGNEYSEPFSAMFNTQDKKPK